MTDVLIDSYSESNYNNDLAFSTLSYGTGQSFTGDGGVLNSCKFYLQKQGSPSGTIYAKIYAHTGTFGSSGKPTGSALAVSDGIDVSTISTDYGLVTFNFNGENKITLVNNTKYVVAIEYPDGITGHTIRHGADNSSPSHSGNRCYQSNTLSWTADSSRDQCFYIYKDDIIIYQSILPAFRRPI
jgi:hypothetical protein